MRRNGGRKGTNTVVEPSQDPVRTRDKTVKFTGFSTGPSKLNLKVLVYGEGPGRGGKGVSVSNEL